MRPAQWKAVRVVAVGEDVVVSAAAVGEDVADLVAAEEEDVVVSVAEEDVAALGVVDVVGVSVSADGSVEMKTSFDAFRF
jgi:hypothetical protein